MRPAGKYGLSEWLHVQYTRCTTSNFVLFIKPIIFGSNYWHRYHVALGILFHFYLAKSYQISPLSILTVSWQFKRFNIGSNEARFKNIQVNITIPNYFKIYLSIYPNFCILICLARTSCEFRIRFHSSAHIFTSAELYMLTTLPLAYCHFSSTNCLKGTAVLRGCAVISCLVNVTIAEVLGKQTSEHTRSQQESEFESSEKHTFLKYLHQCCVLTDTDLLVIIQRHIVIGSLAVSNNTGFKQLKANCKAKYEGDAPPSSQIVISIGFWFEWKKKIYILLLNSKECSTIKPFFKRILFICEEIQAITWYYLYYLYQENWNLVKYQVFQKKHIN